jgi:peptidoglycan LD-endopeptidase LytH
VRVNTILLVTGIATAAIGSVVGAFSTGSARGNDSPGPTATSKLDPKHEPRQSEPTTHIGEVPADLLAKRLTIPVVGIEAEQLTPQFFDARGQRGHEAIDIVAPRGEPVIAVEDGTIAKLFLSKPGGITIYQFDPTEKYAYYYAHLDRYADGLAEGDTVKRGQVLGYVGSTGNASAAGPHLHFAIFLLGPEKKWWRGEALDPYSALTQ